MATTKPGPAPAKPACAGQAACAVTLGLSSLLGRHLAAALAASGRWSAVAVLDPSPSPPSAPSDSPLLRHLAIDLSHREALEPALAGPSAIFHVDAMTAASVSDGSFRSLHRLAVEGTRRLLASCCVSGVGRVVYTGSADVVAAGARDVINADEDAAPYPDKFGNAVSELRVQVEMMVLSAECGWDGRDEDVRAAAGMRTCVLRPG